MRVGKKHPDVKKVSDDPKEPPSHNYSLTCHCIKCNCYWKLHETLYCPDCGGSHSYEVIDPIEGYAPEG